MIADMLAAWSAWSQNRRAPALEPARSAVLDNPAVPFVVFAVNPEDAAETERLARSHGVPMETGSGCWRGEADPHVYVVPSRYLGVFSPVTHTQEAVLYVSHQHEDGTRDAYEETPSGFGPTRYVGQWRERPARPSGDWTRVGGRYFQAC